MNRFYVYIYKHPITLQPFYVGKGTGGRANWHLKLYNRYNCHFHYTINKIEQELGIQPIVEIVKSDLIEDEAYLLEIKLIKKYGRIYYDVDGILTNVDPGGNGPTLTTRIKISESLTNKIFSEQHCKNLSSARIKQIPPKAKVWKIQSPDGKIFEVMNLKQFCIDAKLAYDDIKHNLKGKKPISRGSSTGWRCLSAIPYKLYTLASAV